MTPAGARYSKAKRGILPRLMVDYMADRKTVKNEMLRLEQEYENTQNESLLNRIAALDAMQMAIKILLNSCYGATANEHFRFYKHDHAASITLTGQYLLRSSELKVDSLINEKFGLSNERFVIYCDTDSIYFCLDPVIQKFNIPKDQRRVALEKITRDIITPMVNGICQECCDNMGSYENKISFKLEISAPSADDGIGAVWVGKKKYALKVESSEGVVFDKPKFKVKGLEMVRSSTPKFIRDHLKDSLPLVFDGTEKQVQEFIEKTRQEFYQLSYDRVAFPRSANNLVEYSDPDKIYKKGTPIAVRGALLYNHHLKRLGLTGKYRLISEGMKVRFAYLKTPNILHENIIAFPVDGEIPSEFNIIDKIDYETQYQKTMIDAMQIILTAIGWNAIETSSLDDFFG